MILLPLLLAAAQTTAGPSAKLAPADPLRARYEHCIDIATSDPVTAQREAASWQLEGGGFLASQCLGMAYANQQRWDTAAGAFDQAARAAERAHDPRSANYWQQAGNAWLAAGDAGKARAALDAALAGGTLTGLPRGEAYLDRARAAVAGGDLTAGRSDLDHALADAREDPLAWLLSATLARRSKDMPRAHTDIAQALALGGDDSAVQLEAGNIAAVSGDANGARAAWQQAATLHPDTPAAKTAKVLLAQFDAK